MRLPRGWLGIDVIGTTRLDIGIFIHSCGGQKVAKPLHRVGMSIGFDREGEQLFATVVTAALKVAAAQDYGVREERSWVEIAQAAGLLGHDLGVEIVQAGGLLQDSTVLIEGKRVCTHWVIAPDRVPVALVVWIGEGEAPPRPIYNSWILDIYDTVTVSGGDDLSVIGDGRVEGETRPIRDLLMWCNVDDGPNYLAFYWTVLTGRKGMLAEAFWSIKPPFSETWTHFWSTTRCGLGPTDRTVYGMSVELAYRELLDTRLTNVIAFTGSTLLLADPKRHVTVFASGALAGKLGEEEIETIWEQLELRRVLETPDQTFERVIEINGIRYRSSVFTLPLQQQKQDMDGIPTAVLLKAIDEMADEATGAAIAAT